jgi:holliday junction DNA helicase RuvA
MISFVSGTLREINDTTVVVDVGGVGLEIVVGSSVIASLATPGHSIGSSIGQPVTLMTRLIIREDSFTLFGFAGREARAMFDMLVLVPQVGPKTAMSVIAALGAERFIEIVVTGDTKSLTSVPGIGKKTAERILLEMRDKLKDTVSMRDANRKGAFAQAGAGGKKTPLEEAREALVTLGFSPYEAFNLLKGVDSEVTVEKMIEYALKSNRR